jgi:tetratricopeptide (TPR) repeat protein
MAEAAAPPPPMGADFEGWVAEAVLASVTQATVYRCVKIKPRDAGAAASREAAVATTFRSKTPLRRIQVRLPRGKMELIEWRDASRPESDPWYVVVVPGERGTAQLVVDTLWEWGRDIVNSAGWGGGLHYTHDLASQLVRRVMGGMRGLRVGDKALEPREVKGSGYFSIALGARLVGAGAGGDITIGNKRRKLADSEDVAVKVFVGDGAQGAFEAEVRTLRTLTAKISPAALVVRLVGVVATSEGGALPWPALVMTPLCVESLEQRIDRFAQEPYTLQEAVAWAGHVALSLHRLHRESRLRHGDVTLRNVLLGRDGRAYLADMGVAEHNHPYGRQPQQEGQGKDYSASVAPEMVASSPSSDARADVWSWGVLLHALLTRSTAVAKGGSVTAYLPIMVGMEWWDEVAALWGAEELPEGAFKAVRHALCERGERVGLLAGAVLLGHQGLVEAMVMGTEAPEEVKKAELDIARLELSKIAWDGGEVSPADLCSQADELRALAAAHEAVGDKAQAIACLQQAARLFPEHTDDIKRAQILNNLAVALQRRGDHQKAAALLKKALAVQRRLLPEDHPDIATSLNNLATCHDSQGKYGKAVLLHEEALAMRRRLLPEDHPDIASSLNNLAKCHFSQGEYGKAELLHEEALAMQRRLLPEDHPSIASSLNNLATCHDSQGEYGKAVLLHEEALAMRRRLLPEDHPDIATSLNNLATCHFSQGEYGKAALLQEEALAMQRRLLPEDHPDIASSLNNLADCHFSQGGYGKAALLHEEALAMRRRLLPEDHPHIALSLNNLAKCHFSQGEYGRAAVLHEEALTMLRRRPPEDHPDIASSLNNLAICHSRRGEYGKAVLLHEEALAMRRRLLPEDHPEIGWSTARLGSALEAMGDYAGAVRRFEEAFTTLSKSLPPDHPELLRLVDSRDLCRTLLASVVDLFPDAVAGAVDWSSKSVVELEAFLRSRGMELDLGGEGQGQVDRAILVEAATAVAAEEEEQQGGAGQTEGGRWGHSDLHRSRVGVWSWGEGSGRYSCVYTQAGWSLMRGVRRSEDSQYYLR